MASPELGLLSGQSEIVEDTTEHSPRMRLTGAPLGPDSWLWKLADNRLGLTGVGLAGGQKQLLMEAVAAGVDDHSTFFEDEWGRIARSMPWILGAIYDKDAEETGRSLRDFHINIKGKDAKGKRYHALDPETFADTFLTFADMTFDIAERFDSHNFTPQELEQLWAEHITWYQNMGVSDRCLPATYEDYKKRSKELENEYVMTKVGKQAMKMAVDRDMPRPMFVPEQAWPALKILLMPTADHLGRLTVAALPEKVRKDNNIRYSTIDKGLVKATEMAFKVGWGDNVPDEIRYHPRALAGIRRAERERTSNELTAQLMW